MQANLAAYVAQGGNIAFFGANTCWWRITYDDDLTGFACNRDNTVTRPDATSGGSCPRHEPGASPEDSLTGVSYRNAGGWWWPGRPQIGFEVQRPDHWVFEGGVDPEFGAAQSLVGYECDGAELTFGSGPPGEPAVPTFNGGTPAGFTVLAVGRLVGQCAFENRDPDSLTAAVAPRAATMGVYTAAGTVFNAAVVDWARVLEDGEPNVDRITRNVLARLGGDPAALGGVDHPAHDHGRRGPEPADRGRGPASGLGPRRRRARRRGRRRTARSARAASTVAPRAGAQLLGPQPGLRDVAAFVSEDDGLAHVLVARVDGTITDLSFTSTAAPRPSSTSLDRSATTLAWSPSPGSSAATTSSATPSSSPTTAPSPRSTSTRCTAIGTGRARHVPGSDRRGVVLQQRRRASATPSSSPTTAPSPRSSSTPSTGRARPSWPPWPEPAG